MARLRVVLDTNITASAFTKPGGRSAEILQAAADARFQILVSLSLLRELAKVLRGKFGRTENEIQRILRLLAKTGQIVQPQRPLQIVTADPTDNRMLECAEAGNADLIGSNDHHLRDLGTFGKIPIIAGPDFRRMLGLK